ncbi:MAG: hypothetical protein MSA14_05375, partial [Dialister sp.]|nr:hypothetical protein [Dialister sp.]
LPIRLLHERAREDQTTISSPPGTYRAAFHFVAAQVRKGPSVQRVLYSESTLPDWPRSLTFLIFSWTKEGKYGNIFR